MSNSAFAGGGIPGGSSTQLQYNLAGAFAGAGFSAVNTSGNLLTLTAQAAGDTPLVLMAASGQTADTFKVLDASGNPIIEVNASRSSNPVVTFHTITGGQNGVSLTDDAGNFGNLGLFAGEFIIQSANEVVVTGGTGGSGQVITLQDGLGNAQYLLGYIAGASGTQSSHSTTAYISQSGSASYVAYKHNVTENSIGSGTKIHTQFQLGGTVYLSLDRYCRAVSSGTAPGIAAGTGYGTVVTGPTISGTDTDGIITVTAGLTASASATVVTVTFANAYAAAPKTVTLTPANSATALLSGATMVYAGTIGASSWVITSGTTGLTSTIVYQWYYRVNG